LKRSFGLLDALNRPDYDVGVQNGGTLPSGKIASNLLAEPILRLGGGRENRRPAFGWRLSAAPWGGGSVPVGRSAGSTERGAVDDAAPVHLVGVAGCGMSGLAQWLAQRGDSVTGSARAPSPIVERLRRSGVRVLIGPTARAGSLRAQQLVYA